MKLICTHVQARCVCTVVCHSLSLCLHVSLTRSLFQSSRKLTMHAANNWCLLLINFGCHNVMCTLICSCTKQGKGVAVYSGQQSMYQWKTSVNNKLKLHVEKQSVMKWLVFGRFQIAGKCCQFEQYHPISPGPCTCSVHAGTFSTRLLVYGYVACDCLVSKAWKIPVVSSVDTIITCTLSWIYYNIQNVESTSWLGKWIFTVF